MTRAHRGGRLAAMIALLALVAGLGCQNDQTGLAPSLAADRSRGTGDGQGLSRLQHVVVIYLENHSFDNLYGEFPGANGLANAAATSTQTDGSGTPYATLPMNAGSPFPDTLPNAPFAIEQFVPGALKIPDLVHRFYQEQMQIDGGTMDHYALVSDVRGESMGTPWPGIPIRCSSSITRRSPASPTSPTAPPRRPSTCATRPSSSRPRRPARCAPSRS